MLLDGHVYAVSALMFSKPRLEVLNYTAVIETVTQLIGDYFPKDVGENVVSGEHAGKRWKQPIKSSHRLPDDHLSLTAN